MAESSVWMVTGGVGYIGGHTVPRLLGHGHKVIVLDDLSSGLPHRLPDGATLIEASVLDTDTVTQALREHKVTGVIHFAGRKSVPESVADPMLYYRENLSGTVSLLTAMVRAGTMKLVFSSSAAVYGVPKKEIVDEDQPTAPINPYGHSKLVCEQMIKSVGEAHGLSWLALRYFNAVGADDASLSDRGISNLFPLIFNAFAEGRPALVTGDDFETPDGTGVRDYIHVADLADVHVAAVKRLNRGPVTEVVNVGTGRGYSVLEVVAALEEVVGRKVPYVMGPRRPGDSAKVVASVERALRVLDWSAQRDLKEMVSSAWHARQALEHA
jgi:UDP-glucose 4-epimerase